MSTTSPVKQQKKMFEEYLKSSHAPKWTDIIKALEMSGCKEVAQRVCEAYGLPLHVNENGSSSQLEESGYGTMPRAEFADLSNMPTTKAPSKTSSTSHIPFSYADSITSYGESQMLQKKSSIKGNYG